MVEQNPALIQPLLQQIAATNPALAQTVAQNPQALYDLLGAAMGGEMDEEDDGMGGQVMQIDLTQEEAAAVERVSLWPPSVGDVLVWSRVGVRRTRK